MVKIAPDHIFDSDAIEIMVRRLAHRGPDGQKVLRRANFSLGHTRLNIVDRTSRSNQPLSSRCGRVHICYNGEIYNYRFIRAQLESLGHEFVTASDTEVLLNSYIQWGTRCVDELNGMFAFAIYDERDQSCHLFRDRLGIKPLYYTIRNGILLFASELPALMAYPGLLKSLNINGISSFLSYRHVVGDETYFANVKILLPAHHMCLVREQLTLKRYWSTELLYRHSSCEPNELRALITDAVNLSSAGDLPVSLLLSGGLDSSILACELAENGISTDCFSAQFSGLPCDESDYAELVAKHFRHSLNLVPMKDATSLSLVREITRIRGKPLGMHNDVATCLLARQVALRHKIVLCGEGADELFAGYGRIFRFPFEMQRASWLRLSQSAMTNQDHFFCFLMKYSYFPQQEKMDLFRKSVRLELQDDAYIRGVLAGSFSIGQERGLFDAVTNVFLLCHLPGLLEMLDNATMQSGVEARVPFLDHRIVEFALRLAPEQKLRWKSPLHRVCSLFMPARIFSERMDTTKYVLRKAYEKHLPRRVRERAKAGFAVPLTHNLTGRHRPEVENLLFGKSSPLDQLFEMDALLRWYGRKLPVADEFFGRQVWHLCNLALFLQEST